MSRDTKVLWMVMTFCAAYATVRYNLFKGVAWSEWPVYVLNMIPITLISFMTGVAALVAALWPHRGRVPVP